MLTLAFTGQSASTLPETQPDTAVLQLIMASAGQERNFQKGAVCSLHPPFNTVRASSATFLWCVTPTDLHGQCFPCMSPSNRLLGPLTGLEDSTSLA